jgi:hypothetical protein
MPAGCLRLKESQFLARRQGVAMMTRMVVARTVLVMVGTPMHMRVLECFRGARDQMVREVMIMRMSVWATVT